MTGLDYGESRETLTTDEVRERITAENAAAVITSPKAHDTLPRCPLCGHEVWSWTRHLTSRVPGSGWLWRRFWR